MRNRPNLYVSYESEMSLLPTWTKRIWAMVLLAILLFIPLQQHFFTSEDQLHGTASPIPILRFLGDNDWMRILTTVAIFAIGALGLHILSGLTGQVSLGHAFFFGIGAYTAAVLGGEIGKAHTGMGLPIWIWLPAAGIVAAAVGAAVAPTAVRVRGIYLAIVTLGLVFIGEQWLFRNLTKFTGGSESGREFPEFVLRLWNEEEPLVDFTTDGPWFGIQLSEEAKIYLLVLLFLVIAVIVAKNIQRTRPGRAFMAIRDRDIAAEVMGVPEARAKLMSFALSSAFAGIAGALYGAFITRLIPETFGLFLSVQFLAIILIGGVGTVTGTLLGSAFIVVLPRLVQDFTDFLAASTRGTGLFADLANLFVSTAQDDAGLISTLPGNSPGLNVAQANLVLYGLLLIVFLIFEPLGLYGIWIRIRNYWKSWPFTY